MAAAEAVSESKPTREGISTGIARNTFFGIVAKGAQIGTRLLTIPIVIADLGLEGFGIWTIIMTAAAYMRFGSVGVKSAFQKYVAEARGREEYELANKLLSTGCALICALSIAVLIPSAIFSEQLARAAGVPNQFLSATAQSIRLLAMIMLMSNVGAVFEAIVMGGHRIDIARNLATVFTVAEAVAIIAVLHWGMGLLGMTLVMAVSELAFVTCCYYAARRIVPEIRISLRHVKREVIPELVRYAGSYQLVNLLEVGYNSILPIAVLHAFGASMAGLYAIATRLVSACLMFSEAFLAPILSGGTTVFASNSPKRMQALIYKSFKALLALTFLPLAFTAMFGKIVVYAWTGQSPPSLELVLWLTSLSGLFQAFSLLALVLYRVSGLGLMDNLRQILRIAVLVGVSLFAKSLGFFGVLTGLVVAEFTGMTFMLFALATTFRTFRVRSLLPDAFKFLLATALILTIGFASIQLPLPGASQARVIAILRLCTVFFACFCSAWPVLRMTNAVTSSEGRSLREAFSAKCFRF